MELQRQLDREWSSGFMWGVFAVAFGAWLVWKVAERGWDEAEEETVPVKRIVFLVEASDAVEEAETATAGK